jgi:hypothetical protein
LVKNSLLGLGSFAILVATILPFAGCSRSDKKEDAATTAPAKIEPIEGMKYYVGGPVMKYDKYGRMRLAGFNGEVSNPTTRGLLLGFKKNPDSSFDYRTWLNGSIISESSGFLDSDGLLWYRERLSYDANGAVVVRQKFTYDDERKVMNSTLEHLDPADGAVVKTVSDEVPYTPPAEPAGSEDSDDDDADDESVPNAPE